MGKALHFREKFLRAQTADKLTGWLLLRAGQPEFRKFHGDLLRAWLLARHAAMIENFLDGQGISHEGAFLKGAPPPPEEAALRKGIRMLCEQSTMRTACLYLGFTLASDENGFWAALPTAISAESLTWPRVLPAATAHKVRLGFQVSRNASDKKTMTSVLTPET